MANDRNDRNRTSTDPSRSTGAYSIGAEDTRRRRPGWLIPLLVALGLLLLLGVLLSLLNRDDGKNKAGKSAASNSPAVTGNGTGANSTPGAGNGASTGTGTGTGGTGTGASDGQLLAGGTSVLPLQSATADLSQYAGQDATSKGVSVQSVPADEGFWVGSSEADRVWVQLTGGAAESGYTVKVGDKVDFEGGKVVPSEAGFASKVGVTAAEGAAQLEAQKRHIEVPKGNVKLSS